MTKSRQVADFGAGGFTAGKNAVINGDFGVAQRGTTINTAATTFAYTLDRLWVYSNGPAVTTSQQLTNDTTNLPFIQYCARLQRQSGQTSTTSSVWNMPLETKTSMRFVGQTVTLSFYARKSSTYTASLGAYIFSGTGADQSGLGGYTGQATVATTSPSLTTTWTRYSISGIVASTATELRIEFNSGSRTGTAGANDYFEVTGVQLEVGNVATPFTTSTGTVQGELAACQRYYYQSDAQIWTNLQYQTNVNVSRGGTLFLPQFMRTVPTLTFFDSPGNSGKISVSASSGGYSDNITPNVFGQNSNAYAYYAVGTYVLGYTSKITASAEL